MNRFDQHSVAGSAQAPLLPLGNILRGGLGLLARLDPGLLLLLSGAALLAAALLLPAAQQAAQAEQARDQAVAQQRAWVGRLAALSRRLDLLQRADRDAVVAMAMEQLRLAPAGTRPLGEAAASGGRWLVETVAAPAPARAGPLETPSLLAWLVRDERRRLVVMALAAACVFAGLLPPAAASGGRKGPCAEPLAPPLRGPGRARRWAALARGLRARRLRGRGLRGRGLRPGAVTRVDLTGARRRRALATLQSAP